MNMKHKITLPAKQVVGAFLLLFVAAIGFAQPKQNSPYSRYGIGDPLPSYFASQAAMGGMTAAFHDPFHLNLNNPASYAFLKSTALETGIFAKQSNYESGADKATNWSGNLGYLALGFTLKSPVNEVLDRKKSPWQLGMGLALTPYSLVGYNVQTADNISGGLDSIINTFEGNGGSYKLNWTNAIKYKHTAIGLNLGWMFGKASYENTTVFVDSLPTFTNTFRDAVNMNGFVWGVGVQHDLILKYNANNAELPTKWITIGASLDGQSNINTATDILRLRSRGRLANGQYQTPDTLVSVVGQSGILTLPSIFRLGAQFVSTTKFKLGVEYSLQKGSAYRNDARPDTTFRDASSFSFGMEYTPDASSYNNYFRRVHYRLGGYYRQDIRVVSGEGLNDIGLTFGAGFPIVLPRQQTSFVNAAVELGQFGAGSPIKENYVRLTLGFTLNDNSWFYKRRFE